MTQITCTNLLLVEGKDEANLFEALLLPLSLPTIQVIDVGGKDKFSMNLNLLNKMPEFDSVSVLGIVRDAEQLPAMSAFGSICSSLSNIGLEPPEKMNEVFENGGKRISVFISPDNNSTGCIENICLNCINNLPVADCLDAMEACAKPLIAENRPSDFNPSKSRVKLYLALLDPNFTSLGVAAKQHCWDFEHPCFHELVAFLKQLYEP